MVKQLLRVSGVTVVFGGLIAVNNVDLQVSKGELVGLIGPNGAGKTTLLNALVGRNRPSFGKIELDGTDISHLPSFRRARLGLGISHQIVRPFPGMTVLENVTLAAGFQKTKNPISALLSLSRRSEQRRAGELLELVGIADAANRPVDELPLGYLKRLEVARALAIEPKLLLLDEPLAGLNEAEAHALANTIQAINSDSLTIILIEHNVSEVARISSKVVVLNNGLLFRHGLPGEVLSDPAVHAIYMGKRQSENA